MRQQDPLPRKPKQPQPPAVPFDPNNPSTWPKATPSNLAELQAKAGYKPLTGKATGSPVQPDTNMYNAGTMDVLRGAGNAFVRIGDEVLKKPAQSALRTLSTSNIQTAINPKSTATQRINAIGEDIINVASIVPAVRSAASALEAASMARYLKRLPAVQAEQRAAWDAYDSIVKQAYADAAKLPPRQLASVNGIPGPFVPQMPPRDVQSKLSQLRPEFSRPPLYGPSRYELAKQKAEELRPGVARYLGSEIVAEPPPVPPVAGPNIYRGWHTNPEGIPLPNRLNPWENYIGVEDAFERRGGSPQGNLLSSGLYNTDGRPVSGTYGVHQRYYDQVGYNAAGSYLPLEATYGRYTLDDFVNINTPISQIDELKGAIQNATENPWGLQANHPFIARERNRVSYYPVVPDEGSTVINADDLDISKWNFGGKNPEEITLLDVLNAAPNEESARAVVMALEKPVAVTNTARTRYPLFRTPGGGTSKIAHGSEDMPSMIIESGPFTWQNYSEPPRSINYRLGDRTYSLRASGYKATRNQAYGNELFPKNVPFEKDAVTIGYPGQNYVDLPMKKNPITGAIEEVGGMKALDLGQMSQAQRDEIANATKSWLESLGINEQRIQNQDMRDVFVDLIDRIQRPANSEDLRLDFFGFRQSQDDIAYLVNELTGNKFGKDQWYKMLKDELGYEAFPHPGGITAGGSQVPTHQPIVFNSPEKLPPYTYVPPVKPRSSNEITAERMNEYLKQLATARMLQPGKTLSRDFSGRVNKQILNLAKRGAVSPINTYAQNLAGNR